jgi:hypothetical protein
LISNNDGAVLEWPTRVDSARLADVAPSIRAVSGVRELGSPLRVLCCGHSPSAALRKVAARLRAAVSVCDFAASEPVD